MSFFFKFLSQNVNHTIILKVADDEYVLELWFVFSHEEDKLKFLVDSDERGMYRPVAETGPSRRCRNAGLW